MIGEAAMQIQQEGSTKIGRRHLADLGRQAPLHEAGARIAGEHDQRFVASRVRIDHSLMYARIRFITRVLARIMRASCRSNSRQRRSLVDKLSGTVAADARRRSLL